METKRCPKCGDEKPLTKEFWYVRKDSKDGFRGRCKGCMNTEASIYVKRHKQNIKQYQKQYAKEYSETAKTRSKEWAAANPIKRKKAANEWVKRNRRFCTQKQCAGRKALQDWYVRFCIKKATGVLQPSREMMELKRQQISMKRTLKQFKTWRKEHESNHADV